MAVYAQSGNRVKKIDEDEIQRYVEQGYKVIDAKGTVLNDAVPNDIQELKLAYRQHVDEIKSLKSEVERLKKQLVNLEDKDAPKKEVVSKSKAVEEEVEVQSNAVVEPIAKDDIEIPTKPQTQRKRKSTKA